MHHLHSGKIDLTLDPWRGGGITSFKWQGIDVFRPDVVCGSPLDLASFAMVPFCNRIARGSVRFAGKQKVLPIGYLGIETEHALHGVGWHSPWRIVETTDDSAKLELHHDGALWPWMCDFHQTITVLDDGYCHELSVTNRSEHPMPAGLGLHPFFPRAGANLELEAWSMWETGPDRLPARHVKLRTPPEWFSAPGFDACFSSPCGDFSIRWPGHRLSVKPSPELRFTHVYTPAGADYFCVEPVSHIPDAVNSDLSPAATGLVMLEPGQTMKAKCQFELEELA